MEGMLDGAEEADRDAFLTVLRDLPFIPIVGRGRGGERGGERGEERGGEGGVIAAPKDVMHPEVRPFQVRIQTLILMVYFMLINEVWCK